MSYLMSLIGKFKRNRIGAEPVNVESDESSVETPLKPIEPEPKFDPNRRQVIADVDINTIIKRMDGIRDETLRRLKIEIDD